jgi:hypothetical protein
MKKVILINCLLLITAININAQQTGFSRLTGPYLGQNPPGESPEAFTSLILFSENAVHGCIAFYPDGKRITFASKRAGDTANNSIWVKNME